MRIFFLDPAEMLDEDGAILPLQQMPPHVRAAIRDVSCGYGENADEEGKFDRVMFTKATFHDKAWAATILARYLGLMTENSKHPGNGSAGALITVDWDRLFTEEPVSTDETERRLQEEEAKAGLQMLPPPCPVVVDAVASPAIASNEEGKATNGKPPTRKPRK